MKATLPYTTVGRFLDHWDGVRMVTLELLKCLEDEDLLFRPIPSWRTVGELFHHIGAHQFYVARGVLKNRWAPEVDEPDEDWDEHRKQVTSSITDLHQWLSNVQDLVKQWFKEAEESTLSEIQENNPWHEGMRGWLLVHHAYQDEVHHRGQLYAIIRQLNKTLPDVFAEENPSDWNSRKGK